MDSVASQQECLAKKENNHEQMYLSWKLQGDGFNYYYCSMCGWIKPDLKSPVIESELKKAKEEALAVHKYNDDKATENCFNCEKAQDEAIKKARREVAEEIEKVATVNSWETDYTIGTQRELDFQSIFNKCQEIIEQNKGGE